MSSSERLPRVVRVRRVRTPGARGGCHQGARSGSSCGRASRCTPSWGGLGGISVDASSHVPAGPSPEVPTDRTEPSELEVRSSAMGKGDHVGSRQKEDSDARKAEVPRDGAGRRTLLVTRRARSRTAARTSGSIRRTSSRVTRASRLAYVSVPRKRKVILRPRAVLPLRGPRREAQGGPSDPRERDPARHLHDRGGEGSLLHAPSGVHRSRASLRVLLHGTLQRAVHDRGVRRTSLRIGLDRRDTSRGQTALPERQAPG